MDNSNRDNHPFFSIVVPVYNVEKYLDECINSILEQTINDYEIILVDDGSTDNSGQLCDAYKGDFPELIQVIHQNNGGLSSARNTGIRASRGEFLLFVDSDDIIANDALETIKTAVVESSKSIDIILSAGFINKYDDKLVCDARYDVNSVNELSGEEALIYTAKQGANWSACGKAFRTAFWKDSDFCFCDGRNWEDFQLIDKVVLCANVVKMVSSFYIYRHRSGSITRKCSRKDLLDVLKSMDEWQEYISNNNYDTKLRECLWGLQAYVLSRTIMGYSYLVDDNSDILNRGNEYKKLLEYDQTRAGKIAFLLVKTIGYNNTCRVLAIKKKINRV